MALRGWDQLRRGKARVGSARAWRGDDGQRHGGDSQCRGIAWRRGAMAKLGSVLTGMGRAWHCSTARGGDLDVWIQLHQTDVPGMQKGFRCDRRLGLSHRKHALLHVFVHAGGGKAHESSRNGEKNGRY